MNAFNTAAISQPLIPNKGYELRDDFNERRITYLKWLLPATLGINILLFGATGTWGGQVAPILCLLIALGVCSLLRWRGLIVAAIYSYLGGLIVALGATILTYGSEARFYFLFFLPIILGALMLDDTGIWGITAITIIVQLLATTIQSSFWSALGIVAIPAFTALCLTYMVTTKSAKVLEMMYWAMDVQQKDTRRAQMFYEQREELSRTLLELNHANSKLELTNVKLEAAQRRAENASKAKSIFLSNMSHELRTPLNVVIGYSSAMLKMPHMFKHVTLPEVYHPYIQLIQDSGQYLLGLINDVLDLSKIEAGKLELHCTNVALPELFHGIIATSIGLLKDRPLQIRPEFPESLPLVWADPMRVRQILLNLMSNAIKFTQTGSVTLRTKAEDNYLSISVIDTGIGIPELALHSIFDRFQQAEHDTDKRYGGTGLGLDISKQLSMMHGGNLTVESIEGQGSTFTFTLPISTVEALQQEKIEERVTLGESTDDDFFKEGYSILVVEDEVSTREMLHHLLKSEGYVVFDTHDGTQALELAEGLLPDAIILDLTPPNLNGQNVLKALKANPETAKIRVILCTAGDHAVEALALGAYSYLQKPFTSDEVVAAIAAAINK